MDSVAILRDGHQPTHHVLTMAHMHVCNLQTLQNWGCQLRVELGGKTQAQMEIQGHGPDLQRGFSKCLWGHCIKLRVELQRENEKKLVFSGIAMGLILSEKKPWNFNGIISLRRNGIVMGLFHEGKSSYNGWLMRIPSWIVIISICVVEPPTAISNKLSQHLEPAQIAPNDLPRTNSLSRYKKL